MDQHPLGVTFLAAGLAASTPFLPAGSRIWVHRGRLKGRRERERAPGGGPLSRFCVSMNAAPGGGAGSRPADAPFGGRSTTGQAAGGDIAGPETHALRSNSSGSGRKTTRPLFLVQGSVEGASPTFQASRTWRQHARASDVERTQPTPRPDLVRLLAADGTRAFRRTVS